MKPKETKSPVKQLIGDKILLLMDTATEKTKVGIFIPETLQEDKPIGLVVAVGKTELIKSGDRVFVNKNLCTEIEIDDVKYQLLKENDAYFILQDDITIKQLVGNKIALKLDAPEIVSKGGIILTDNDVHPENTGEVIGIGPKVEVVKVGNKVRFAKHCGREVEIPNGEKYHFITELDVLLILNK